MASFLESSYVDLEMGLRQKNEVHGPDYKHRDGMKAQRYHGCLEHQSLQAPPDSDSLHDAESESALMMKRIWTHCDTFNLEDDPQVLFQRLRVYNIILIQRELAKIEEDLSRSGQLSQPARERMNTLLHRQVQANRDQAYFQKSFQRYSMPSDNSSRFDLWTKLLWGGIGEKMGRHKQSHSYWQMASTVSIPSRLRRFLSSHLPRSWTWSRGERMQRQMEYELEPQRPLLAVELLANAMIALGSATSIILPIIIITFNPSRTKSLVTLSASVILFGVLLTTIFRAKNTEVFVAVATYAAVLVVFLGTSGTMGS